MTWQTRKHYPVENNFELAAGPTMDEPSWPTESDVEFFARIRRSQEDTDAVLAKWDKSAETEAAYSAQASPRGESETAQDPRTSYPFGPILVGGNHFFRLDEIDEVGITTVILENGVYSITVPVRIASQQEQRSISC